MALGKANPGHDPIDYDDIRVGAEIQVRKQSKGHNGDSVSSSFPPPTLQMTAAASGVVPDDTFTVSQAVNALGFGKFQVGGYRDRLEI